VGGTACPYLKTCTGAAQYMEQDLKTSSTFAGKSLFTTPNSILCAIFFLRYELFHKVLFNILLK
jgi:hypothetical protein